MSELARIDTLAAEINHYHAKCEEAVGQAVAYAMEAGDRLAKVKDGLGHGEWLPWLEKNFKGTPRTAQAYMRVAANRGELEMRSSASHLSLRGALRELSAPREEDEVEEDSPVADEEVVELVRMWMEMEGPTELSDVEQEAFERRLAKPGERERDLLKKIGMEHMIMLGMQVSRDGFLVEDYHDGCVIEWRDETKKKLYRYPFPEPGKTKLPESARPRIKRGAKVYAITSFQMWRHLSNWFTEVLLAEVDDVKKVRNRIEHNADWRQAEAAGEFIRDRMVREGFYEDRKLDMEEWALRHQVLDLKALKDAVFALERVWVRMRAEGLEEGLMGGDPP
jgi:hypothetical protein